MILRHPSVSTPTRRSGDRRAVRPPVAACAGLLLAALLQIPFFSMPVRAESRAPAVVAPVSASLQLALTRSRAAHADPAYRIDDDGRGRNPRHRLDLAFTPAGLGLVGDHDGVALRLQRFGRNEGVPTRTIAPRIEGAWIDYARGPGLVEWFANLPQGLEHGWTVTQSPQGSGPLMLELDTGRTPDEAGADRMAWAGLAYRGLVAVDGVGQRLPSTWRQEGARLRIEIDDRGATYPILVDPWLQQDTLLAADGSAGALFGIAVAISGDTALIGAKNATVGGNLEQGAAYVFVNEAGVWTEQAKLVADDGAIKDFFGGDVLGISGDTAVVGAGGADIGENEDQGAAYVFVRNGTVWSQQAKLTASDGAEMAQFGIDVAVIGDTVLVGALTADVNGNDEQGAAYVYVRSGGTWSEQAKLVAADGMSYDRFGKLGSLLAEDIAAIGAFQAEVDDVVDQGAAYVFVRDGTQWQQQAKLVAPDPLAAGFGVSVSVFGDRIVVGAPATTVAGHPVQGAAYVYVRDGAGWTLEDTLVEAAGTEFNLFGMSVMMAGDSIVVGAPYTAVDGQMMRGRAHVFTREGAVWSEQESLTPDDGAQGDTFGISAAMSGGTILVGASGVTVAGNSLQGATYAFAQQVLADIEIEVEVSSEYAQPGEVLEYLVTLHNAGPDPFSGIDVASVLSPELDLALASWVCLGPVGSGCTSAGTGNLEDQGLTLVAGESVSYLLSAPTRPDADGAIETQLIATAEDDPAPANNTVTVVSHAVLLRDGFEGDGD